VDLPTPADGAAALQQVLLDTARAAVEAHDAAGGDPGLVGEQIVAVWQSSAPSVPHRHEPSFTLDPTSGVEAMAFLIERSAAHAPGRGGIVLRLPGELPDSFEPVALPPAADGHVDDLAAVRASFFSRPARLGEESGELPG